MSILRAFGRVFGGKNVRFFGAAELQNSAPSPRDFNVFLIPQSEIYCAVIAAPKTLKGAKLRAFLADGVLAHFALEGDFAVAFYDKDGFDASGRVSPVCAGAWWRNLRVARARVLAAQNAGANAAQKGDFSGKNGGKNGANSNLVGGTDGASAFKNYFVFAVRRDFFANFANIDKIDISLPECVSFGAAADGESLSFIDNCGANLNLIATDGAKAGLTGGTNGTNGTNGDFFVAGESFLALYRGGAFYDVKHVFAASAEDYLQRVLDFEFVQANFAAPFVAPAADGVGYELVDGADLGENLAQNFSENCDQSPAQSATATPKTLPIYSTFLDGFAPILPNPAAPFLLNFTPKEATRAAKLGFVAASLLAVFLVFGGTKFAEFKAAQTLTAQLQNQLIAQKSQSSNLTKLLADLRAQNKNLTTQISLWRDQNGALNATLGEVKNILNAKPISLTLFELAATAQKSGAKIAKFEFDGERTSVLINAQKQEMLAAFLGSLKTLRSSKIEQRDGNFYSEIILK